MSLADHNHLSNVTTNPTHFSGVPQGTTRGPLQFSRFIEIVILKILVALHSELVPSLLSSLWFVQPRNPDAS